MSIERLTETVEHISSEWQRYAEITEQKSYKIQNLEQEVQELKGELSKMNIANQRPELNFMEQKNDELNKFIRGSLRPEEVKYLSSDDNARGGFSIAAEKYPHILASLAAKSPMRQLASVETISSNVLELVIQDGKFASGWVAERDLRAETDNPSLIQKRINVHELYAQPKATQRLLDDSYVDIEAWLTEQLVDSFARAENSAFIKGDGINKPKGILTYADITQIAVEDDHKIAVNDLLNLLNSLDEEYAANATFLMNRRTLAEIQKLRDNNGRFIWQAAISERLTETIFGIPVVCCSDMPDITEDNLAVAIADFKAAYKIVDRQGIAVMKDPYTEKPFVKFYATKRVGGDVINKNAIKLLKI